MSEDYLFCKRWRELGGDCWINININLLHTGQMDYVASISKVLGKHDHLNKDLEKYIYNLYAEDNKGIKRSNQGGWHSQSFQLGIKDTIQNKFAIKIQEYILNCFQNMGWKTKDKNIRWSVC